MPIIFYIQCHEVFERQCETVLRDECNTITEFSEQCSHHYDAAHYIAPRLDDLHHHAAPAHHQQCVQVPHHREVCHKEPVQVRKKYFNAYYLL